MSKIGKEIVIFIGLFLFLTLGMHMQQWISHPIKHLEHLSNSQFGLFHPLYFTALVYVVVYFIRVTFSWIKKLFMRKG